MLAGIALYAKQQAHRIDERSRGRSLPTFGFTVGHERQLQPIRRASSQRSLYWCSESKSQVRRGPPRDIDYGQFSRAVTDPDARLYRKGEGKQARLCYMGHALGRTATVLWSKPASREPSCVQTLLQRT
jgi:hypothetical protein